MNARVLFVVIAAIVMAALSAWLQPPLYVSFALGLFAGAFGYWMGVMLERES